MKLAALFIALAMLTMVIEGCERDTASGDSYGQKLDRAIEKSNQAILQPGDKAVVKVDQAGDVMATVVAALSDTAWITTGGTGDAAITASIKADFLKDPDISGMKIDVETRNGVVWLNGLTDDEAARARAEQIARVSKGVVQVNNHLAVKQL